MTALELAKMNCNIIFACRDKKKTLGVIDWIKSHLSAKSDNKLEFVHIEMSNTKSVDTLIKQVNDLGVFQVEQLVNNAGLAATRRANNQNVNMTFGVNHVSHFKLTEDILEKKLLAPKGRIVNVSSVLSETVDRIKYDE